MRILGVEPMRTFVRDCVDTGMKQIVARVVIWNAVNRIGKCNEPLGERILFYF